MGDLTQLHGRSNGSVDVTDAVVALCEALHIEGPEDRERLADFLQDAADCVRYLAKQSA
jgi:hypothetical protein